MTSYLYKATIMKRIHDQSNILTVRVMDNGINLNELICKQIVRNKTVF